MGSPPGVMVLVGTRPEAVKLAPVVLELREQSDWVRTCLVSTGQHADLVGRALRTFGLAPDHDLGIMREGQSLFHIGSSTLSSLEPVLHEFRPDLLLVQGDTATVLFGALAAYFGRVRLGHVEAGLRSGDKWNPYPEEMCRRITSELADLHFAPTWVAHDRLLAEGVPGHQVHVTGNTVVDALALVAGSPALRPSAELRSVVNSGRRIVLVTAHRRESHGPRLRGIFGAVRTLAAEFPDVRFVVPVHPNPSVREAAAVLEGHDGIHVTAPLDYGDVVSLLQRATLVLTDSGGIQEEAPSFHVPVLVLRDVTERAEGIGTVAELVGTDPARIVAAARRLLADESARLAMTRHPNPYGDGRASARIADLVIHTLTGRRRLTRNWEGIEPMLPLDFGDLTSVAPARREDAVEA